MADSSKWVVLSIKDNKLVCEAVETNVRVIPTYSFHSLEIGLISIMKFAIIIDKHMVPVQLQRVCYTESDINEKRKLLTSFDFYWITKQNSNNQPILTVTWYHNNVIIIDDFVNNISTCLRAEHNIKNDELFDSIWDSYNYKTILYPNPFLRWKIR